MIPNLNRRIEKLHGESTLAKDLKVTILYTFFHECDSPDTLMFVQPSESWLIAFEMAETISISITCLFILECFLSLVAFGPQFYLPGTEHWKLHVFDVVVVVSTFVLEIVLRGKEREVAGLLIILRLWRIVKVMEAVVVGLSLSNDEEVERLQHELDSLKDSYAALTKELAQQRQENESLKQSCPQ
ncbi:hypothetical protein DM01DRAFT_1079497 [Hesseltinella vesiculosa]|uniref:Voltage-gated hydrogen channel 1 n=1 Tax=Hesseltinella vesiculosa TaxID=101127 RepID=A0A1X2GDT4_9FUNG|nr:hypothetical protein DM01DRAFT_1079497 [Hesseltinella vesiculosa]